MLWREVDEFTSWWVNKLLVKEGSRRVNKLLVIKENSFSCYSVFLCKQLVHSSTRWLVYLLTMLLCLLFTLSTSNLLTCLLVDLSTYHVTLSFIYPVYKQLVDLSTRWLVNKKNTLPCIFNKFCYICKLFNTYVSHVCWDYRYFILWV